MFCGITSVQNLVRCISLYSLESIKDLEVDNAGPPPMLNINTRLRLTGCCKVSIRIPVMISLHHGPSTLAILLKKEKKKKRKNHPSSHHHDLNGHRTASTFLLPARQRINNPEKNIKAIFKIALQHQILLDAANVVRPFKRRP